MAIKTNSINQTELLPFIICKEKIISIYLVILSNKDIRAVDNVRIGVFTHQKFADTPSKLNERVLNTHQKSAIRIEY